jgi:hypothetical protein
MEMHNKDTGSVRSEAGRTTLNRFPLVGLAMILASAATGCGFLYFCCSLASW